LLAAVAAVACLMTSGCSSSSAPAAKIAGTTTAPASHQGKPSDSTTTASAAATSGLKAKCPTAAAISAVVGSTYPTPKSNSGAGEVICNYASGSTNLVISFAPTPVNAASLKQVAQLEAKAQGVQITPVSGIGDAAYVYTLKDAGTNTTGVATNNILALAGSHYLAIVGEMSVAKIEAVAKLCLSQ
jgi:hypothetical protein